MSTDQETSHFSSEKDIHWTTVNCVIMHLAGNDTPMSDSKSCIYSLKH